MQTQKSFIENADTSLFPLACLPYGVFKTGESTPRIGTAIGDYVLDLSILEKEGLLSTGKNTPLFDKDSLNLFAAQGKKCWDTIRSQLQRLLSNDCTTLKNNVPLLKKALVERQNVEMLLPFHTRGFSDFYASIHHASNVGRLFRGNENPLLPNWKYLPVAYNGRASTIYKSGTCIARPQGQIKHPDQAHPTFGISKKLDFELEMGIFVGVGNADARPIPISDARSHVFGLTLLNDWSARDIQSFEYQPLGPFLSKSFATSISPWVVPIAALEAFTAPLPPQIPETVPYLRHPDLRQFDIKLKVELLPRGSQKKMTLCETNYRELYWTMEQMLAHHTINNCVMQPGDLLGSGTISGAERESWGSLLEITANGTKPIQLVNGEERTFLEDGDTIIMTGYCEKEGYKISFGSLEGTIAPPTE